MKCIVCNSTFEMSQTDYDRRGMHEPAYCSESCFIKHHDGAAPQEDDLWNIHTGPVTKVQPAGRARPEGLTLDVQPKFSYGYNGVRRYL